MTDFQSAFDTNTRGIDTTLTTQLSSVQQWANIPGSLVKASSSAAGYLWGFNSGNLVYVCQQPCTGQWTQVDLTKLLPTQVQKTGCYGTPVTTSPTNFFYNTPFNQFIAQIGLAGNPNYVSSSLDGAKALAAKNPGARGIFTFLGPDGVTVRYCVWDQDPTLGNLASTETAKILSQSGTFIPIAKCPPTPYGNITALDIATDETNVYLLFSAANMTFLGTKTANNQTDWSLLPVGNPSFVPTNIFSTHTYLWLQTATNQKAKIPKPINMTNSMPVSDTSVKITSSSSSALYGIDASGNAMKTDETLQTGWAPIAGLQGKQVSSLVGDLDQSGLFAINATGVSECEGDCSTPKISTLNTQGYMPLYLTGDPSTKQLWMTSSTPGVAGNIFNRIANPDYSSISGSIAPLDKNRDGVVTDVTKNYTQQTQVMTVNQELSMFKSLFTQLFGDATKAQNDANTRISQVEADLQRKKKSLEQLNSVQPTIQKFVVTLAVTALVYAIFSPFGWYVHGVALVVLVIGIYLTLNNDVNLSTVWTRLP
jgi:hypothetical protein